MNTVSSGVKRFKRGDMLADVMPFAFVTLPHAGHEICDHCAETAVADFRCLECHIVSYCGEKCQKESRKLHEFECEVLSKTEDFVPFVLTHARLLVKVLLRMEYEGGLKKFKLCHPNHALTIHGMRSDIQRYDLREAPSPFLYVKEILDIVCSMYKNREKKMPAVPKLMDVYKRLVLISRFVVDVHGSQRGRAVYLGLSEIQHSCDANAVTMFSNGKLRIRASQDIAGDQIKVKFAPDEFLSTAERRRNLYVFFGLGSCDCRFCLDTDRDGKMTAALCLECGGAVPMHVDYAEELREFVLTSGRSNCSSCGAEAECFTFPEFVEAVNGAAAFLSNCAADLEESVDKWNRQLVMSCKMLDSLLTVFHKNNIWIARIHQVAVRAAIALRQWKIARFHAQVVVRIYTLFTTKDDLFLAMQNLTLGKLNWMLGDSNLARNLWKVSKETLKEFHTDDDPNYLKDIKPFIDPGDEPLTEEILLASFPLKLFSHPDATMRELTNPSGKRPTLKPGEIILTDKPFAHVLANKLRKERCDWCLAQTSVKRCSGCQWVYYCGNICQVSAWKRDHKFECSLIKKASPRELPSFARLMVKILFRLKKGEDLEEGKISKTRRRVFRDLMSHYPEIKEDPRRLEHFQAVSKVLEDFFRHSDFVLPNASELLGIFGRISVNCFNLVDGEFTVIGSAVYLAASIFDHSCDPNAVAIFNGHNLEIRSIKEIPDFDLNRVFISYIDQLQSTVDRKRELHSGYYFSAVDLSLCVIPVQACPKRRFPIPFLFEDKLEEIESELCAKCHKEISVEAISDFLDVQTFSREQLKIMKDTTYLDVCRGVLNRQSKLFHPVNIWRIRTLDAAFDAAINLELWSEALEYGRLSLDGYREYLGSHNPMYGLQLLRLAKLEFLLNEDAEAREHVKTAARILSNSHGTNHPFYSQQVLPLIMQACTLDTS
ncbi:unnamed protein product [Notodromas monacha]|uniref:MYND-type domain-containing protein n=1 Tax=Notodromas monacha TaxID=399045 RepID=A0A7R9BIS1_9CRUS|nr:unnamed protein product [Notodromas monacha]CAG0915467.1 unnamed protein product [Notodromas monacha]